MQNTQYSAACNKNVLQRRVPLPEDEIAEQIWRHALNYRFSGKERARATVIAAAMLGFGHGM